MRKLAAAAVLTALAIAPGTAHADPPDVTGVPCHFLSVTDPQNPSYQTGVVYSSFVAVDDPQRDPTGNPAHGHIDCIFKTGNNTYAPGGEIATATSAEMTTVVTLIAPVSFPDPDHEPLYLCTVWTATDAHGDTVVYYVDGITGLLVDASSPGASYTPCADTSTDTAAIDDLVCGVGGGLPAPVGPAVKSLWGCP
jgi:hypothetical protein